MQSNDFEPDLIFDLGMHQALDTRFYLDKGFRVTALEANPKLAKKAMDELSGETAGGRLRIVDRALWNDDDLEIPFFVNPVKDDWSSAFKNWAEKEGHASEQIAVGTITLGTMFDRYGVPYYIKCDIEGADELFGQQLLHDARRPAFVSVEASSLDLLAVLFAAGYDRVQIVNQAFNGFVRPPEPPREGKFCAAQFNGHMSGLFGRELDPKKWMTFSTAAETFLKFLDLKKRDNELAYGWLDFHVTSKGVLG